jgi:molybdate transport system substrate-binding protein
LFHPILICVHKILVNMKRLLIIIACLFSTMLNAQTVRVAAAGNLRFVLDDIKAKYAKVNPKADIQVTLGSSGALTQQIINGADFDFFMAADIKFPQKLKEQGCVEGLVKTYAFGKLVLWSNTLDVSKGIESLKDPKVTRIAIAKPDVAPYGERAIQCLKYYNLYESMKDKLVYADNISQAAQFAESGNAEIAFIAYALVFGPEMQDKGNYFVLDTQSYKPVEQACVLLKGWQKNPEAAKFMNFVLSEQCRPIFEKYGFILP